MVEKIVQIERKFGLVFAEQDQVRAVADQGFHAGGRGGGVKILFCNRW